MMIAAGFYENATGREEENRIALAVLRAVKEQGINKPVGSDSIVIEGLSNSQVESVADALRHQGLLESASVKRGFISIRGYRLGEKGAAVLQQADGVTQADADKDIIMRILQAARDKTEFHFPADDIGQRERMEKIGRRLVDEGMLKTGSVRQDFFTLSGGIQITEHGLKALAAHEGRKPPRPDDIQM